MNPFELPPTSSPVSFDPPSDPKGGSRRRRVALAVFATAGLVGGGVLGVGQLTSADGTTASAPTSDETTPDETTPDETTSVVTDGDVATSGEPAPDRTDDDAATSDEMGHAEIVIDRDDGDPITIDLDDLDPGALERLGECTGFPLPDRLPRLDRLFDEERLGELEERLDEVIGGVPPFLPDLSELGRFELHGDGGHVTVVGPDGVSFVVLGDGDASVTITRQDGELSIETDGDATVDELPRFDEMLDRILPPPVDLDALEECLSELG